MSIDYERGEAMDMMADEMDELRAELEAAKAEVEQLRVQLAGCGVAALGSISEPASQGDYGWSPAYQDVLNLRQELEAANALLCRWCDGFEEIDRGALCRVYEDTEQFLAECEKEEESGETKKQ